MANLSIAELYSLAASVGFADPVTAAAIAMAESGGNPDSVNDTRGQTDLPAGTQQEQSIGLWQINTLAHPQYDPASLHDPTYNANAALAISKGGTNFNAWSTFTTSNPNLSYQRFMPAAQAASGNLLSHPVIQVALIIGAGAGAAWLIEHGWLSDAIAVGRRGLERVRTLLPI